MVLRGALATIPGMDRDADRPEPPPNILLFLADDMGLGDTSAYQDFTGNADHEQIATPQLDRLARCGIRFTDAHATSSLCSPSRYALLTGRYCYRSTLKYFVLFGVQRNPIIEPERPTLASVLRDHGYRTALIGKWHVGVSYRSSDGRPIDPAKVPERRPHWDLADLTRPLAGSPLEHGFDYFWGTDRSHTFAGPVSEEENTPSQAIGPGWLESREGLHGFGVYAVGATGNGKELDGSFRHDTTGKRNFEKAILFLGDHFGGETTREQPFFLYYGSHSNHTPYTPSDSINGVPVKGQGAYKDGRREAGDPDRLDFIHENDVALGQLMDYLEATEDPRRPGRPLIENTLILFTSDNGADIPDACATGRLRSNKGSLFEGGHRVPLIASWPAGRVGPEPGANEGEQSAALIGLVDLYATLHEILELPLPDPARNELGGEDSFGRLACLRGEAAPPRPPLHLNEHKQGRKEDSASACAWLAFRHDQTAPDPGQTSRQWKLLVDEALILGTGPGRSRHLFDLGSDLREERDLLGEAEFEPIARSLHEQSIEEVRRGWTRPAGAAQQP